MAKANRISLNFHHPYDAPRGMATVLNERLVDMARRFPDKPTVNLRYIRDRWNVVHFMGQVTHETGRANLKETGIGPDDIVDGGTFEISPDNTAIHLNLMMGYDRVPRPTASIIETRLNEHLKAQGHPGLSITQSLSAKEVQAKIKKALKERDKRRGLERPSSGD